MRQQTVFFERWESSTKGGRGGGRGGGNCMKGGGEGFCRKGEMLLVWIFFFSWSMANVIITTFNYILVILFPLNVGVSPCFHCTVLVPVYRVCTSCFHNQFLVPFTGYILPVCIMEGLLLVSVWACSFNLSWNVSLVRSWL